MSTVLFLSLLAMLVYLWQDSLRAREYAIIHCRNACHEMNFQLLDETVALVSFRLRRTTSGQIRPLRQYRFEFSIDGLGRSMGHLVLHGDQTQTIQLEHPDGIIILPQNGKPALH